MASTPYTTCPRKRLPDSKSGFSLPLKPILRTYLSHLGSYPQTSGCRSSQKNRFARSAGACGSRTIIPPWHPCQLDQSLAGSWWGQPGDQERSGHCRVKTIMEQKLRSSYKGLKRVGNMHEVILTGGKMFLACFSTS